MILDIRYMPEEGRQHALVVMYIYICIILFSMMYLLKESGIGRGWHGGGFAEALRKQVFVHRSKPIRDDWSLACRAREPSFTA